MAVPFLTKIVKIADGYDLGKMKRVLKYLKGTKHMKLTLQLFSFSVVR